MNRNTILKFFFAVFLVALVCYFQACSPVRFSSLPTVEMDSGNGFGYGGKPTRDFYHYVPEFTCEGKSVAQSRLSIFENVVELSENSFNKCESSTTSLALADVQTSSFHEFVVGHRGNIFELSREVPKAIPDVLIEAWCSVNLGGTKRAEILVNFDRKNKLAQSQITVGEDRTKIFLNEPAQSTAREVRQYDVDYKIGETTLNIDKRKPSSTAAGQFEGAIRTAKFEGSVKDYTASCYTGGLLDSRLWPAEMIFDANASQVELNASQSMAYIVEKPATGVSFGSLFSWDLTSLQKSLLIKGSSSDGVRDFRQSPDSEFLVLRAQQNPAFEQVFKLTLLNKNLLQLNTTAVSAKQWPGSWMLASDQYRVSSDSKFIFYVDGTHDPSEGDVEPWLYRVPASGGAPVLVNHVMSVGPDLNIYSNIDFSNDNRVFYLAGDAEDPHLFVANLESGEKKDITPNLGSGWYFNLNMLLQKQESSNSFFAVSETMQNKNDITALKNRVYQFSNDGQLLKTMEFKGQSPQLSPQGKWYYSQPTQRTIYNPGGTNTVANWDYFEFYLLSTGQKFTIPLIAGTPWNFDSDESSIIYWNTSTHKMTSTKIATNYSSDICNNSFSSTNFQKVYVLPATQPLGHFLIGVTQTGLGQVFQTSGSTCQLKNTFLVTPNASLKFSLHEASSSLFIAETTTISLFVTQTVLKLVPTNGLPPLGVTQALRPGIENFEQHFLVPEKNLLILVNRDRFTGMRKVYKLTLTK